MAGYVIVGSLGYVLGCSLGYVIVGSQGYVMGCSLGASKRCLSRCAAYALPEEVVHRVKPNIMLMRAYLAEYAQVEAQAPLRGIIHKPTMSQFSIAL